MLERAIEEVYSESLITIGSVRSCLDGRAMCSDPVIAGLRLPPKDTFVKSLNVLDLI
ncbi:13876_t:CDS:2 [Funneliformis mosseae]|uniref:13876_t:CDS:1 n=1 Tax=Funneliformis mosseae TaxID=27381 RepID=A0A9N9CQT7_FUNMO|nr:13876_t:CDS:2 [Funneliformis mosseae]